MVDGGGRWVGDYGILLARPGPSQS